MWSRSEVGTHCLLNHSLLNLLRWSLSLNTEFTYWASLGSQLGWEILYLCFLSARILSGLPRMPDLMWSQGFSHAQCNDWLSFSQYTFLGLRVANLSLAPIGTRISAEPKLSATSPEPRVTLSALVLVFPLMRLGGGDFSFNYFFSGFKMKKSFLKITNFKFYFPWNW